MRYLRDLFPIVGIADDGLGSGGMLVISFNLTSREYFMATEIAILLTTGY
jgi:hypothetical protein